MRALERNRLDLIDALVAEADIGGVTAALLEKDEHLTDALRTVFGFAAAGAATGAAGLAPPDRP